MQKLENLYLEKKIKKMKTLTLDKLKEMPPYTIIDHGWTIDNPNGINIDNSNHTLYWVAKRGEIHDWAIYVCPYPWTQKLPEIKPTESKDEIIYKLGIYATYIKLDHQDIIQSCSDHGTKIQNVQNIQKLVPCNDEALDMYRH